MFSICAHEYIIAYKMIIHNKTIVGLEISLFNNIYVEIIKNTVKGFKTHRCALNLDSLFLRLLVK